MIRADDRVATAGSCFASNLVPWLRKSGVAYLRSNESHPAFVDFPDYLGYDDFSAAYGNVYTARHLLQLLQRALGKFAPSEDRWHSNGVVIDPFRPGLRFPARDDEEFDILTRQHLEATRQIFAQATVFVFTLGLTEAWVSAVDGAAYPACPGTVAGAFDETRHVFHNFTAEEVKSDLVAFVTLLRSFNPKVRIIFTVSPVPLVATATDQHVLLATTYSKSVLRVAAQEVCNLLADVFYFPAYEIITGPQAPLEYYAANRREVTEAGVEAVMHALFAHMSPTHEGEREHGSASGETGTPKAESSASISSRISQAECDEAMMDVSTGD